MVQRNILDSYEELVVYTAEIRESLDILHEWLSRKPNFEDYWSYYDLIAGNGQLFALLNLIMHRMDCLTEEHGAIVREEVRTGVCKK